MRICHTERGTYTAFVKTLGDETGIQKVDEAFVNFAVEEEAWSDYENRLHREDVMPSLRKKVNSWLENTQALIIKTLEDSYICTAGKEQDATKFFKDYF